MNTKLDSVEINPPQKAMGTVILLHGLGADGHDFVSIVSELHLPSQLALRFVFPHAPLRPVTVNNGYVMRAWFDILGLGLDQQIDEEGILKSSLYLESLIQKEIETGTPANKIVVAGFSQGAVIALNTGLRYKKSLAGVLALSGYLPNKDSLFKNAAAENYTTPIFIGHGTQDNIVPYFLAQKMSEALLQNKYLAKLHTYNMAHSVCGEEVGDIADWLRKVYQ